MSAYGDDVHVCNLANNGTRTAAGRQQRRTCRAAEGAHAGDDEGGIRGFAAGIHGRGRSNPASSAGPGESDTKGPLVSVEEG